MKKIMFVVIFITIALHGFSQGIVGTWQNTHTLYGKEIKIEWTFNADGSQEFYWWEMTDSTWTLITGNKGSAATNLGILTVTINEFYNNITQTWESITPVIINYQYVVSTDLQMIQDLDENGTYETGNIFGSDTYDQYVDPTYVLAPVQ